jgi:hypothetical protein
MAEEHHDGSGEFENPPSFFPYDESSDLEAIEDFGQPVEVRVEAVFATQSQEAIQRFVLLSDGIRKLPIVIGGFEAMAISLQLDAHTPDRPMTHDLLKKVIEKLDGDVVRIFIDDFVGGTYYAKIIMRDGEGDELSVDSRPSDAIALAVRCDAPIFVADGILEQHGH